MPPSNGHRPVRADGPADVLIVGAGSAGSVLAGRLSENPALRVWLIEAGEEPDDPRIADPAAWPALQGSAVDWAFNTEPQPGMGGRRHPWPRGRAVGGTSVINAMGHMRGHPADFDAWHAAGATGWTWQALRPYFIRSECSPFAPEAGYGGSGPIRLSQPAAPHPLTEAHRRAGRELGMTPIRDHNGPRMHGPTLNTMTIANGRRQTVAEAYLTPRVRARPNLRLLTGFLADRLVFDAGARACGIAGTRHGRPVTLGARAGVILAAGAIGSPAILMRSGIGPAGHLADIGIAPRRDMPGLGENLQDHLLAAGNVYRAGRPVPPSATQHSESLCYLHARGQHADEAPALVVGIVTVPVVSDGLADRAGLPQPGAGYTLLFGITHPYSRGTLRLDAADPQAPPRIDPAYLSAPEDQALFGQALDRARGFGLAHAYDGWRAAEVLPEPADLASPEARRAFIRAAVTTHHHPVGTCRMGRDARAVTTPDLALIGVPGVFVVDGSILPTLTTGPVNAAILAVAERAADMLGRRFATGAA